MTPVHPSTSVEDAMTQLDTRIPLLYREQLQIVESLYDLGFDTGAKQGREAGIEHVQNRLREIARATTNNASCNLLLDIADSFDSPHAEYRDPTTMIREKLTAKARARDGK
jgi:hypothetical protein